MIAPARRAAFDVLRAVEAGRTDLGPALARARTRLADERDRALANELAIGTLRLQGRLDHVLAACSSRPLARLDPEVLTIARLAAYQLLHLDRIPAAAVVNDAVQQVRLAGKSSAAGFMNAVLRAVSRRRHALPLPERPSETTLNTPELKEAALAYLSVSLSHPRWLVERWLDRWSFEDVERWLQFNNAEAPLTIRTNTLAITRDALAARLAALEVECRPAEWAPDALVPLRGNPLQTPLADAGLFHVQDEASQIVPLLAGAAPGRRVLDACAAPGGKTLALAAQMPTGGTLVAADLRPNRIALLRRTLGEHGVHARIVQLDLEKPLPFGASFDTVLLDAPCSGLGTLRRDPEIRWRRRPEQIPAFAAAQRRMLRHAAAVVAPGGALIYATCSSEPDENEGIIAGFLEGTAEFRQLDRDEARSRVPPSAAPLIDEEGHLRTWPFRHGLEAFFGAVLTRRV